MGEVSTRLITAIGCIIFTLSFICYNIYTTCIYYLTLTMACLFEYHYQIDSTRKKITIVMSTIIYGLSIAFILDVITLNLLTLILPIIMSLFSIELFSHSHNPMLSLGTDLIGIVWIGIPMFLMVLLSYPYQNGIRIHNPTIIIGIMFFVFLNDAGAYFAGKKLGRTKLFPRVSPKKTWEGTVGGCIISLLSYFPISTYFTILPKSVWFHIFLICIVCGGIGDLIESMFKRDLKIKDTGTVLPGHGGVLDRVDGLLYSIPFVYSYLLIYTNI